MSTQSSFQPFQRQVEGGMMDTYAYAIAAHAAVLLLAVGAAKTLLKQITAAQ